MVALAFDPRDVLVSKRAPEPPEPAIGGVLAVIRRLAGVAEVHLLRRNRGTEAVEIAAGTEGRNRPVGVDLLQAIDAKPLFMLSPSAPRWIASPFDGGGQALLTELTGQGSESHFLLLCVPDISELGRARISLLVPDLVVLVERTLSLSAQLTDATETRDAAREALDHGECGVIAVRGDHSIVFSNTAGAQHLEDRFGLRLRRGVLRPVDYGKAIRFEAALDRAMEPAGDDQGARPRASVMLLDGTREDPRLTVIVIAPARSTAAGRDLARGAAAMVYIVPPAQRATLGLDALCRLHGLSRVEGDLIAHLMEGLTISEAAVRMRIKIDTARTYLKQVFGKTGMHRQTDLVALMARYLRATRGDFDFQPA